MGGFSQDLGGERTCATRSSKIARDFLYLARAFFRSEFVWFHEHALEVDRAYRGVRLSFALAFWLELAEQYPIRCHVLFDHLRIQHLILGDDIPGVLSLRQGVDECVVTGRVGPANGLLRHVVGDHRIAWI